MFDKQYNFLDVAYSQLSASGSLSASYTAKEAGYAHVYVSNEHPTLVDVYFDDITISYTPGQVIQSNEYYPYGMQAANSWTRTNVTNKFLANGGTEYNSTTQLYDLDYRNYDPVLGRLSQVDPMADRFSSWTSYQFSYNNPTGYTDKNGAQPWSPDWAEWYNGPDYGMRAFNSKRNAAAWANGSAQMFTDLGGFGEGYDGHMDLDNSGFGNSVWFEYEQVGTVTVGDITEEKYDWVQHSSSTKGWDTSTLSAAVSIALTTSAADGPVPIGEAIGAVILGGAAIYNVYENWDVIKQIFAGKGNANYPGPWSYTVPDPTMKLLPEYEPEENHFPNNNPNASTLAKIAVWTTGGIIMMNELGIDIGKGIGIGIEETKSFIDDVKNKTIQGINDFANWRP
ncbi:MAG: hypothetical protein JST46_04365 [Bacteroidetes bacterium]|nr:hypothetical protein [Bacteroidota bacterium]